MESMQRNHCSVRTPLVLSCSLLRNDGTGTEPHGKFKHIMGMKDFYLD
jgi:hypothetical protein